jgi:hypothetical protein
VIGASDAAAAQALARSNRLHVKPTPYELGGIYRELLIDAVYETQKDRAAHLGVNESEVTNTLIMDRFTAELLSAFKSPLRLRYGDARPLRDAWEKTQIDVQQRIAQVLEYPPLTFTHNQTVDILLDLRAAIPDDKTKAIKILVHVGPTLVATIRMGSSKRVIIKLAEKKLAFAPSHRPGAGAAGPAGWRYVTSGSEPVGGVMKTPLHARHRLFATTGGGWDLVTLQTGIFFGVEIRPRQHSRAAGLQHPDESDFAVVFYVFARDSVQKRYRLLAWRFALSWISLLRRGLFCPTMVCPSRVPGYLSYRLAVHTGRCHLGEASHA